MEYLYHSSPLLFRLKVLAMLLRKKKITPELIRILDGWRHSGFNVFAGGRIQPRQRESLENLATYLIPPTFAQKRMDYSPEQATVLYRSKDGKEKKTYDALEWLAQSDKKSVIDLSDFITHGGFSHIKTHTLHGFHVST